MRDSASSTATSPIESGTRFERSAVTQSRNSTQSAIGNVAYGLGRAAPWPCSARHHVSARSSTIEELRPRKMRSHVSIVTLAAVRGESRCPLIAPATTASAARSSATNANASSLSRSVGPSCVAPAPRTLTASRIGRRGTGDSPRLRIANGGRPSRSSGPRDRTPVRASWVRGSDDRRGEPDDDGAREADVRERLTALAVRLPPIARRHIGLIAARVRERVVRVRRVDRECHREPREHRCQAETPIHDNGGSPLEVDRGRR